MAGPRGSSSPTDCRSILQANIAIAPSNPRLLYAIAAAAATGGAPGASGPVGFYKSTDAGEHWQLVVHATGGGARGTPDPRPLARIGGGDLPTILVDPKNENVVYSCVHRVLAHGGRRPHLVGGARRARRRRLSEDVDQSAQHPTSSSSVADQGAVVSANRGVSWSNWYTQPTAAMYHVTTD